MDYFRIEELCMSLIVLLPFVVVLLVVSIIIMKKVKKKLIEVEPPPTLASVPTKKVVSDSTNEVIINRPMHRKMGNLEYSNVFLVRSPVKDRKPIFIERDVYISLEHFVRVLSPKQSVTGLINNILTHHLEYHSDQINEIYKESVSNPVKPVR